MPASKDGGVEASQASQKIAEGPDEQLRGNVVLGVSGWVMHRGFYYS